MVSFIPKQVRFGEPLRPETRFFFKITHPPTNFPTCGVTLLCDTSSESMGVILWTSPAEVALWANGLILMLFYPVDSRWSSCYCEGIVFFHSVYYSFVWRPSYKYRRKWFYCYAETIRITCSYEQNKTFRVESCSLSCYWYGSCLHMMVLHVWLLVMGRVCRCWCYMWCYWPGVVFPDVGVTCLTIGRESRLQMLV